MMDQETQRLLNKFSDAWDKYTQAPDSDARYEAKGDYQQYAIELALWMMNAPSPTETITDLDTIRGNSPDEERENPDASELPHSVRAIVSEIHRAAQQSRRAAAPSARTLLYIDLKTKEGLAIVGKNRLKSDLHHIKATIASTTTAGQKVLRIEQITAMALGLPFQAVQS